MEHDPRTAPSTHPARGGRDGAEAPDPATSSSDLRRSLDALLTLSSHELGLTQLLTRVARYAVQAIPGADGSGLTSLEGRLTTLVATDSFVDEVDSIQYALRQGPCVVAAADGLTVVSGSLGSDRRWLQFGSKVARLGVHSAVSLPLVTSGGLIGTMNVYARAKYAFDDQAVALGEAFAGPAAVTVQNAQLLAQAQRLVERLETAQSTRSVVDRAVGVLMSRTGLDEQQALDRLRTLSQREHRKLPDVAHQLLDEAVRRARSQRADSAAEE